jgi:hypothetical protein
MRSSKKAIGSSLFNRAHKPRRRDGVDVAMNRLFSGMHQPLNNKGRKAYPPKHGGEFGVG